MHATRMEKRRDVLFYNGKIEIATSLFHARFQELLQLARHIALIKRLKTGRHTSTFVPLSFTDNSLEGTYVTQHLAGKETPAEKAFKCTFVKLNVSAKTKPNWYFSVTHIWRGHLGLSHSIHTAWDNK